MSERNKHITISAAGQATRIRSWMHKAGFPEGTPKSVLPTGAELPSGDKETLLGRIVRQAMRVGRVAIYGNYDTMRGLGECPDLPRDVDLVVNRNITGPLGPIYLDVLRTARQSYMAAGDFWAELDWEDFIRFHNSHDKPVSIVVGSSVAAEGGARFLVDDDGTVRGWERVEGKTKETDLINIGGYIIDGYNPEAYEIVRRLNAETHKEDPFNDALIAIGGLAAYVLPTRAFNANNGEVYQALVEYSASRPTVSELESENPIQFIQGAP